MITRELLERAFAAGHDSSDGSFAEFNEWLEDHLSSEYVEMFDLELGLPDTQKVGEYLKIRYDIEFLDTCTVDTSDREIRMQIKGECRGIKFDRLFKNLGIINVDVETSAGWTHLLLSY